MPDDKTGWIKVAASPDEINFGSNNISEVLVGGKPVCIARWHNTYFAFTSTCPHAGGRFAQGFIDVLGNVVCPLHRYKFCLNNGHNVSGEGYRLKRWPLKIENGIYINFGML